MAKYTDDPDGKPIELRELSLRPTSEWERSAPVPRISPGPLWSMWCDECGEAKDCWRMDQSVPADRVPSNINVRLLCPECDHPLIQKPLTLAALGITAGVDGARAENQS